MFIRIQSKKLKKQVTNLENVGSKNKTNKGLSRVCDEWLKINKRKTNNWVAK